MLIAGTAAIAVLASSQILSAQTTTIEIAPEQRTRIKEYVVKEKVRPITVKERVSVGATLPADVELVAVPETWGPLVSAGDQAPAGRGCGKATIRETEATALQQPTAAAAGRSQSSSSRSEASPRAR